MLRTGRPVRLLNPGLRVCLPHLSGGMKNPLVSFRRNTQVTSFVLHVRRCVMSRTVQLAAAMFVLTAFARYSNAQDGCCPPYVPPSCLAPSCVAPSCLAPSCVAPEGCGHYASSAHCCCQQQSCQHCCGQGQYCAPKGGSGLFSRWNKRSVHIDLSKTIIKKNHWGGFGEAPPPGFAVSSMPVLPLSVSAVPVSFNTAAASGSNSDLVAAMLEVLKTNQAAATAAAPADTCPDPCGDIRQLQSDVRQLTQITQNLTRAVSELASRQPAVDEQ